MKLREVVKSALDAIYPRQCLFCASLLGLEEEHPLCHACRANISFINPPFCSRCGVPFGSQYAYGWRDGNLCEDCRLGKHRFDSSRSVCRYESPLRELILAFKLRGNLAAAHECASLVETHIHRLMAEKQLDIVLNVPMHPRRLLGREFDQAALLARAAAEALCVPFPPGALARVVNTRSQTDARDRRKNVKGAFRVRHPEAVEGRSVLLVDDIFTSGSTLDECTRTLKRSSAAAVHVFTLARAM